MMVTILFIYILRYWLTTYNLNVNNHCLFRRVNCICISISSVIIHLVMPADKNLGFTVLDRYFYDNKMTQMLSDINTYSTTTLPDFIHTYTHIYLVIYSHYNLYIHTHIYSQYIYHTFIHTYLYTLPHIYSHIYSYILSLQSIYTHTYILWIYLLHIYTHILVYAHIFITYKKNFNYPRHILISQQ